MKRVLIVASDAIPHIGGKSTHIYHLARGLSSVGWESEILSRSSIPKLVRWLILTGPTLLLRKVSWSLSIRFYRWCMRYVLRFTVARALRRKHFDAVHAHDTLACAAAVPVARSAGVPLILTVHGYTAAEHRSEGLVSTGDAAYVCLIDEEREAYGSATGIIAVDARIYDHVVAMRMRSAPLGMRIQHNFVDFTTLPPPEAVDIAAVDHVRVLCARRLFDKNGVIHAVRAMRELVDRATQAQKRVTLIIAGEGPQRPLLEAEIREQELSEAVTLLGSVPAEQMTDLYRTVHIALVPSITSEGVQEATSLSALEAMALGVPVVASAIGGLAELIDSGRTGELVPEREPSAISDAVWRLVSDRDYYNRIRLHAYSTVRTRHSVELAAVVVSALYGGERVMEETP